MLTIVCPKCGREVEVSDEMLGQSVKCLGCGEQVSITPRSLIPVERNAENSHSHFAGIRSRWARLVLILVVAIVDSVYCYFNPTESMIGLEIDVGSAMGSRLINIMVVAGVLVFLLYKGRRWTKFCKIVLIVGAFVVSGDLVGQHVHIAGVKKGVRETASIAEDVLTSTRSLDKSEVQALQNTAQTEYGKFIAMVMAKVAQLANDPNAPNGSKLHLEDILQGPALYNEQSNKEAQTRVLEYLASIDPYQQKYLALLEGLSGEVDRLNVSEQEKESFKKGFLKAAKDHLPEAFNTVREFAQEVLTLLKFVESKRDACSLERNRIVFRNRTDLVEFNRICAQIQKSGVEMNRLMDDMRQSMETNIQKARKFAE